MVATGLRRHWRTSMSMSESSNEANNGRNKEPGTDALATDVEAVRTFLLQLQDDICSRLEALDSKKRFHEDAWQRERGGSGITRVISDGAVFEKGGVNFSHVFGDALPPAASASRPELAGRSFQAMGVSLVIHPDNPFVPTSHANFRFFIAEKENEAPVWWFGGGYDLTPYYGNVDDCRHWHQVAKEACDPFGEQWYPPFKKACDDYFYLPHRQEPRGVGGLFFDDFNELGFADSCALAQRIATSWLDADCPSAGARRTGPLAAAQQGSRRYRPGRHGSFSLCSGWRPLGRLRSGRRC